MGAGYHDGGDLTKRQYFWSGSSTGDGRISISM